MQSLVREEAGRALPATCQADEVLVARARAGEQDAFEALVRRHQDRVYSIVGNFAREREDVLDLAQESFLKAYQGLPRFRGSCQFSTWLYRIAVNTGKDWLRAQTVRRTLSLEDERLKQMGFDPACTDPAADPAAALEREELHALVREAVRRLPEKLRLAITLYDLEGIPHQQVAAVMGCPVGTAKSHVFRGRARLRRMLSSLVADRREG